jgi:hypothetical protein
MFFKKKEEPKVSYTDDLAKFLAQPRNAEEFLGVLPVELPTPAKIQADAAKMVKYSHSTDYAIFAKECWARVLAHHDAILDEKTPADRLSYHRGALKATLDLLRLSYQARQTLEVLEKEQQSVTPRR